MNVLIVFAAGVLAMALLWGAQSCALLYAGEPLTWPLHYTTQQPVVRWTGRVMIQVAWLVILIGVPLALGESPTQALQRAVPLPVPWSNILISSLIVAPPFLAVLTIEGLLGWLRLAPKFDARTRHSKLLRRLLTPIPLATMEEAVFRGILLEQLLQTLPRTSLCSIAAVVVSAVVFSSAHFIRKQPKGKPVWQQAYGFFLAGCLFGTGYIVGGRNLWVPIVLHAWAILIVEIGRLYCQFNGPRWIIGFAESPYSGVFGTMLTGGMIWALVLLI